MPLPFKFGILFDMDGVLLDSEPLHALGKLRVLEEEGISGPGDLDRFVGVPNGDFWAEMKRRYALADPPGRLVERQYGRMLAELRARPLPPSEGLPELLDFLDGSGIGAAVATSSHRALADAFLDMLGISGRFGAVVTGDDVERAKPWPDVYQRALEITGWDAGHAVAVEDSANGVRAALGAGLRVAGYRNPASGKQDLAGASWRIDRLAELKEVVRNRWNI